MGTNTNADADVVEQPRPPGRRSATCGAERPDPSAVPPFDVVGLLRRARRNARLSQREMAVAIGVLNGFLVAYAEIPSLFTTLAVGIGIAGIGQSGLFEYEIVPWPAQLAAISWIGQGSLLGIPYSVLAFIAAAIIVGISMRKTRLGAFIYASGDNPNAARIAGIPVRPILMLQYIIAGLVAMFAGLVLSASSSSMDTRIFNLTWIYDVILVVVLGGIGLSGGRGGVINVIIGTLLIGTIVNGMTIMNVSFEMQNLIKGVVLLAALSIDSIVNPRNEETAQQGDI